MYKNRGFTIVLVGKYLQCSVGENAELIIPKWVFQPGIGIFLCDVSIYISILAYRKEEFFVFSLRGVFGWEVFCRLQISPKIGLKCMFLIKCVPI